MPATADHRALVPAFLLALSFVALLTLGGCDLLARFAGGDAHVDDTHIVNETRPLDADASTRDSGDLAVVDLARLEAGRPDANPACLAATRPFSAAATGGASFFAVTYDALHHVIYAAGDITDPFATSYRKLMIMAFDDCGKVLMPTFTSKDAVYARRATSLALSSGGFSDGVLCVGGDELATISSVRVGYAACFSLRAGGGIKQKLWQAKLDVEPPIHVAASDTHLITLARDLTDQAPVRTIFPVDKLADGVVMLDGNISAQISGFSRFLSAPLTQHVYGTSFVDSAKATLGFITMPGACTTFCPAALVSSLGSVTSLSAFAISATAALWIDGAGGKLFAHTRTIIAGQANKRDLGVGVVNHATIVSGSAFLSGQDGAGLPALWRVSIDLSGHKVSTRGTRAGTLTHSVAISGGRLAIVGELENNAALEICALGGCAP